MAVMKDADGADTESLFQCSNFVINHLLDQIAIYYGAAAATAIDSSSP